MYVHPNPNILPLKKHTSIVIPFVRKPWGKVSPLQVLETIVSEARAIVADL